MQDLGYYIALLMYGRQFVICNLVPVPYLLTHGGNLSLDGKEGIMAAFTLNVPSPLYLIKTVLL